MLIFQSLTSKIYSTTLSLTQWKKNLTTHYLAWVSANELTIALSAIEEKSHHPSPRLGASANELTIALSATEEKSPTHHLRLGAS
ncbi:hypothetical protein [Dapis sp. BLCC M229]|uniref:hypothetical protein n=1 Tax=Dapis sp. BLCC M229 TaxID=3400188 RepID=UPI003CF5C656